MQNDRASDQVTSQAKKKILHCAIVFCTEIFHANIRGPSRGVLFLPAALLYYQYADDDDEKEIDSIPRDGNSVEEEAEEKEMVRRARSDGRGESDGDIDRTPTRRLKKSSIRHLQSPSPSTKNDRGRENRGTE